MTPTPVPAQLFVTSLLVAACALSRLWIEAIGLRPSLGWEESRVAAVYLSFAPLLCTLAWWWLSSAAEHRRWPFDDPTLTSLVLFLLGPVTGLAAETFALVTFGPSYRSAVLLVALLSLGLGLGATVGALRAWLVLLSAALAADASAQVASALTTHPWSYHFDAALPLAVALPLSATAAGVAALVSKAPAPTPHANERTWAKVTLTASLLWILLLPSLTLTRRAYARLLAEHYLHQEHVIEAQTAEWILRRQIRVNRNVAENSRAFFAQVPPDLRSSLVGLHINEPCSMYRGGGPLVNHGLPPGHRRRGSTYIGENMDRILSYQYQPDGSLWLSSQRWINCNRSGYWLSIERVITDP